MGWSGLAVCADGGVDMHVGTPLVTAGYKSGPAVFFISVFF